MKIETQLIHLEICYVKITTRIFFQIYTLSLIPCRQLTMSSLLLQLLLLFLSSSFSSFLLLLCVETKIWINKSFHLRYWHKEDELRIH